MSTSVDNFLVRAFIHSTERLDIRRTRRMEKLTQRFPRILAMDPTFLGWKAEREDRQNGFNFA